MPRLFSYTIPCDDGAAPNPFGGICTLAICKPAIRRVAQEGDWVVGLGSRRAPSGDLGGHVVYAMEVTKIFTLQEYDQWARIARPDRIPDLDCPTPSRWLGDCIYDYSSGAPVQRRGVHNPQNMETDLGGKNALVSENFWYFGKNAIPLEEPLRAICHQTQGHRSTANQRFLEQFVAWIKQQHRPGGEPEPGRLPNLEFFRRCGGCRPRKDDGETDRECS